MANFTPNLNLKKPLGAESFSVEDQNGNMDKIDTLAVLKGTTAPTTLTVGIVGQFYLNTSKVPYMLYQCTKIAGATYIWESVIGNSGDTVLDIYTNKRAKVAIDIDHFGCYTIKNLSINGRSGSRTSDIVRVGNKILYVNNRAYANGNNTVYDIIVILYNIKNNSIEWQTSISRQSQYYGYIYNVQCINNSMSYFLLCDNHSGHYIIDINAHRCISLNYGNSFATSNYVGCVHSNNYQDRHIYIGSNGFGGNIDLGSGINSNNYSISIIGTYNDYLYYTECGSASGTDSKLCRADIASSVINSNVEYYSNASTPYYSVTFRSRYCVSNIKTNVGYGVWVLDMQNGTSNFSTMVINPMAQYINRDYYIGSSGGFAYFYNHSIDTVIKLNTTTFLIDSYFQINSPIVYTVPIKMNNEVIFSDGNLLFGKHMMNVSNGIIKEITGPLCTIVLPDSSSSYINSAIQCNGIIFYGGGVISDYDIVGVYESTNSLKVIGKDPVKTVCDVAYV